MPRLNRLRLQTGSAPQWKLQPAEGAQASGDALTAVRRFRFEPVRFN